jgi:uncharacterized protein (TIGR04255 family)
MEKTQLNQNPLVEVVLEIRYDPTEYIDYSLLMGLLYEKLRKKYPNFEDMKVPDFGIDAPAQLNHIVKNRFYSEDRAKLYTMGKGIFSVNTLKYQSFDIFLKDTIEILSSHKEVSEISKINRVGLRYINKIIVEKGIEDVFSIKLVLPDFIQKEEAGFNIQSLIKVSDSDSMTMRYTKNPENNEVLLDFDYFSESPDDYNPESIKKWMGKAHSYIEKSFVACLNNKFYRELQNG